jgi:hypothetical protein
MLLEHQLVIHLVDVVAGKDQNMFTGLAPEGIEVLVDGVGGSLVPMFSYPPHGRQNLQEIAQFIREDTPTLAQVPVKGEGLVLGDDENPAKIGVDAVRESDVYNPIHPAKRDSGLGTVPGERVKALALSTRQ